MKLPEAAVMRKYLQDHLRISHTYTIESIRQMSLAVLLERHMEAHGHG